MTASVLSLSDIYPVICSLIIFFILAFYHVRVYRACTVSKYDDGGLWFSIPPSTQSGPLVIGSGLAFSPSSFFLSMAEQILMRIPHQKPSVLLIDVSVAVILNTIRISLPLSLGLCTTSIPHSQRLLLGTGYLVNILASNEISSFFRPVSVKEHGENGMQQKHKSNDQTAQG